MDQDAKIRIQDYIILIDNRNDQRLFKIIDQKGFRWRKIQIPIKNLGQYEYYQKLQLDNGKLKIIQQDQQQEIDFQQEQQNNNKQIYTLEQAQKLQPQEIQILKKNKKGQQIINTIVSNNQQFQKRTAYSKQKYLKKKQRKYLFTFHAEPTCPQNIHKYYFLTQPKNVGGIRWDMLGFMLLQGAPYEKVLIAEKTKGILSGSILYRGAKSVTLLNQQQTSLKKYPILEQLNLSQPQHLSITSTTWSNLKNLQASYTNLMMLGNYDYSNIIRHLTPLLKSGSPIVFYCPYLQPLGACIQILTELKYLNIRLYDSWTREYQVLKNRTHPLMYMDSHPGYLLTAIRVI